MQNELSEEQIFFLSVLKNYLQGNPLIISTSVNWDEVKSIADKHQLTAVFYYQTRNDIFKSAFISQLCRSTNFSIAIDKFKRAICEFQYIMIKGVTIAELYEVPELRTMGDVDVVIHRFDRSSIHDALLDNGFQFLGEAEGEWKYSINGFLFEVHDSLVHRRDEINELVDYFSNVWNFVKDDRSLDWSFHLIYLLVHLCHHLVGSGVGFRQFMDVAIVCKKCAIDWEFVVTELKKINLYQFSLVVFALIARWFEISVPIVKEEISEDFYIEATRKIFIDGVFGFANESNKNSKVAMIAHYSNTNLNKARRIFFRRSVFPKYEEMCYLPYCSYVRKSKLLLLPAWLHRIAYRAFNKRSRDNMVRQLSYDNTSARIEMLKKWGL